MMVMMVEMVVDNDVDDGARRPPCPDTGGEGVHDDGDDGGVGDGGGGR